MKNQLFFASLLAAASAFCPLAQADPIDDLAAQIKADYAYVYAHPQTIDPETLRLAHDAAMVKDMQERDKEVRSDHEAYNKHLQEWIEASRPKQIPNMVTKDNHGNTTEIYDNSHPVIVPPR